MFDALLIITLFLQASFLVCLLTLISSINIKHLCFLFSFITDINGFLEFPTPPFILTPVPPFIKFNKDLRLRPPVYFDPPPPFIRHLRVYDDCS